MISIVIPTFNHLEDCLKPCLESIFKYTNMSEVEIIVSANGCTDGTREYLDNQNIKYIWSDKSLNQEYSFAKAIDEAVDLLVKGEYIVLLNNDIVLLEQPKNAWLDILKAPFKDLAVAVTGPDMRFSQATRRDYLVFFCAMIKKDIFDKLGGLDTSFGTATGEDIDFCIRAEDAGYKLVQVGSGSFPIYHKGGATMRNIDWATVCSRNEKILIERYANQWDYKDLTNDKERAVITLKDDLQNFPMEFARYHWVKENLVGKKVLELGCSNGYALNILPDGLDYVGIDYCQEIIDLARKEHPKATFYLANLEEELPADYLDYWDTIICMETLEHLSNGKELVQHLKEHCDCLLISTPYNEIPGTWGRHHKLHNLTEKDFPGFSFEYIDELGNLTNTDKKLMLMKYVKQPALV